MGPEIIVIAHNLRSSHNVGSLLRTCEGLGVKKIFLSGYSPYPKSKDDRRLPHIAQKVEKQIEKTALGAQRFMDWQYVKDINELFDSLSSDGYVLCALEQSPKSVGLEKFKPAGKIALIIGNEVKGLEKEILSRAEHIVEIPMLGKKESFNVVQAAAMALYAFRFGQA
jgi:tRNA G18 (ribose-2'-O)-methylase SpoU